MCVYMLPHIAITVCLREMFTLDAVANRKKKKSCCVILVKTGLLCLSEG